MPHSDAPRSSVPIIQRSWFQESRHRSREWNALMQSNTREALFGLVGIVIVGIVVWILIGQVRSAGDQQATDGVATVVPELSLSEVPTEIGTEIPAAETGDGDTTVDQESPTATPLPEFHVVQAGETLSLISDRYGLTSNDIAVKNGLEDPNAIFAGQRLLLPRHDETFPAPERGRQEDRGYIVKEGDTLFAIAQEFGVSLEALAEENSIDDQSKLFVGSTLTIPEKTIPTPAS